MRNSLMLIGLAATAFAVPAGAQPYGPGPGPGFHGGGRNQVLCESYYDGNRRDFCPLRTRFGVRIVRQVSRQPCIEGRNWFIERGGVFVRGGCRAVFASNRPRFDPRPY